MKEIRSNTTMKGHNFLKVTGVALFAFVMLVNIVGAEPSANITFVTTGSSFSPIITVTGNPTIQWVFGDGSTSNSKSPTVNFGSARTRENTLVVTPWSAVTKINIGYDGSDGGVTPSSSTIANLKQQNVIAVNGLENVAPYLQVWASSYNPITALDFSNFTVLNTIECLYCRSLSTIKLRNVPSLTRLCVEQSNISYLDLSEAPSLADFRGASQRSSKYTINWGSTGANVWHICIRDNPQMTGTIPFSQFPLLQEFFNWNDNQSGTLYLTSTNLREVLSANNHYNAAVLSGCFLAGRNGVVEIQNNNLISLDISNDPGLLYLNASRNSLNQKAVDGILQILDSYNTNSGYLDLTENAEPSITGITHASSLTTRNWEVKISSRNNPPVANFTSNITEGYVPLDVQFNDSSENATAWKWDFGDGTNSSEKDPTHTYSVAGNFSVDLTVSNANGTASKTAIINVLQAASSGSDENISDRNISDGNISDGNNSDENISDGASNNEGTNIKGSGGYGSIDSPELLDNIESKELSKAFVASGNYIEFDFPMNATPVVYIAFNAKKTSGMTTTIVEMLNKKSILVSELPSDEVYKSLNIWAGNNGFIIPKNIENAIVCFRVEKSWIKDRYINQSSITLNRYNSEKWDQLPTSLSEEDDKYLYFTAETPGFSPFAITGRTITTETEIQPSDESDTLLGTETAIRPESNTKTIENKNGSTASNVESASEKEQNSNSSGKESTEMPGFATVFGAVILNIALLACLLYFFMKK